MSDYKITLTSRVWNDAKHRHLRGRIVWHWKLEFDGRVFDDAGKAAMEAEHAAATAIEKYQALYRESHEQRRLINRKAS